VTVLGGAAFGDSASEQTTDRDLDGLINNLTLNVPVNVGTAGQYELSVPILDASGQVVTASGTHTDLDAGTTTLPLTFDGRAIHDQQLDGPWTIHTVLANANLDLLAIADLGTVTNDDWHS
ncbi:MAG: hypothetical protein HHJ11_13150, partial [Phycicoccus sp.]|nr:hypothetical protein [Phycicoccus sp.]